MIRRGKCQGWLNLPIESLPLWTSLNQVSLHAVDVGPDQEDSNRGSGIRVQAKDLDTNCNPLIVVPAELILSKENINLYAKSDKHLHEVLSSVGDFAKVRLALL